MQTISTKYLPPTNTKPARIVATASGSKVRVIVTCNSTTDELSDIKAVRALCAKMGWTGELIGGHLKNNNLVWVFAHEMSYRLTIPEIENVESTAEKVLEVW